MNKKFRFNLGYLFFVIFAMSLIQFYMESRQVEQIPYSDFQLKLKAGKISDVVIGEDKIKGKLKEGTGSEKPFFVTTKVDPEFAQILDQYHIKYTQEVTNKLLESILSWVLPTALFFGLWIFLMRKMAGKDGMGPGAGLMSIGKSKAKVYIEKDISTTFDDVAGVDEAKDELKEIVEFLKHPEEYGRLGATMPKGVLLVGPPGTGKTLIARAVAGEASVPFFSISGSDFVEMFVGVGAARVRDLFNQAREKAPCIIFIDELDALGKSRGASPMGGNDEKEQTLNQLLVELDGFDATTGIILLGATNRPEILDPALLRAGRFDRQVLVDRPDKIGRHDILKVHTQKIKLAPDVSLEKVSAMTPGFTGADLANLANEAAIVATRNKATEVTTEDFVIAIERIVAGLEKKNRILNPFERKVVAHHEMGHALVAHAILGTDPVQKVSIIPRGIGALGYTIQRPTEDRFLMTKQELFNKMSVLLGGRAAERIIFNHISTGAADDIDKATDIARACVLRYGMDETLGNVTYEKEEGHFLGTPTFANTKTYSEETAKLIDHAIKELVDGALHRSIRLLEDNLELLKSSATGLLEIESYNEEALRPIMEKVQKEDPYTYKYNELPQGKS